MTIHRFFVTTKDISGKKVQFPSEISQQIGYVLRLKKGDHVTVLDNSGMEYYVELYKLDRKHAEGEIVGRNANENEPEKEVILYQALIPRDKFELVLQKATEIGVSAVVPLETKLSLIKSKDLDQKKFDRWNKIIQEAAEQSERGRLPTLRQAQSFEEAIAEDSTQSLVAWERHNTNQTLNELRLTINQDQPIRLFVGPEGGFTEQEIQFAEGKGAHLVSLGKTILRSETAGIVFPSLILQTL
jgi:16S rRNA (uracil1498-N3)-methyltransferase